MFLDRDEAQVPCAPAVRLCSVSKHYAGGHLLPHAERRRLVECEREQPGALCWPWRQADDILSCIIQYV
jgi:hypothetical protein